MSDDEVFVREHQSFVRGIARRTRAQLELEIELEDLVAFGYRGLLEARGRFDPSRGVQFKSFAYYRIRGAIIDGVRAMAYLPRRAYARLRAAESFDDVAQNAGAQRGAAPEARQNKEATLRALDQVLGRAAAAFCMALSGEAELARGDDPESLLIEAAGRASAVRVVEQLPERERALVRGVYFQGRTLDDVAKELGMSKSWASRLHGRALDQMRQLLTVA